MSPSDVNIDGQTSTKVPECLLATHKQLSVYKDLSVPSDKRNLLVTKNKKG